MIRKLMAGSALLALMSAGTISVAAAEDTATKPAVVQGATTNDASKTAANDKLVPESPTLATAFIGRSVYSSNDPESDTIGDVNDLIIGDDGAITDAVVGVGGFLGIGEKDVAVPFDQLQVVERDGEIRLIYAATREQLEAAPAVDLTAYDPAARFSKQQDAMNAAAEPDAATAPLSPAPVPADNMAAAPQHDLTAAPADKMAATESAPATSSEAGFLNGSPDQVRATSLMGKSVYGPEDQSIGEVSDLVFEKDGGTRVALVDVGGFLGIGEKTVAIPFDELHITQADAAAEPRVTVAMTKDQLEQLPTYEPVDTAAAMHAAKPTDNMAAADTPAVPPATVDQANQMAANPSQMTTGAIPATAPTFEAQQVAASDLIGTSVYGNDDANLGEVSDVVFDPSGKIDAVVVDVGGFLGIGEKPVALDFKTLDIRTDQGGNLIVAVNATKDQLDQAPTYEVSMK
jgi:sporulation protein YlmC with PRC-barrel domain